MPVEASADRPIAYKVLEKGSKRGGKLLVSGDGHSYNLRVTRDFFVFQFCRMFIIIYCTKEQLLKRAANRFRAKMRPTEPEDLDFEVI